MPIPEQTCISRGTFCHSLSASLLALTAVPATALDTASTQVSPLYNHGVRLLVQGRRFEKAAEYFKAAAEKEPTESRHPIAFGCACASRVASLVHAMQFREMLLGAQDGYQASLKAWEKDREEQRAKDPHGFSEANFERHKPLPLPTRELFTKDDNQPFHLTGSQIGSVTVNLSAKALTAWEQGVALANTPEEKAHAYYIQGWGIRVLRQYLEKNHASHGLRAELTASGIILKDMPTYENMLVAFDKAIEAAPQNPLYWQAKGDALGDGKEATAPYEKALDLKPRNATSLWYHLYRLVAPTSYEKPENETWVLAAEYLRKAKARDRGNAWPLYEEAVLKFCYAPYIMTAHDRNRITTPQVQEERRKAVRNEDARRNARLAIDLILQGNRAPRYEPPRYVDSVPNLLAVAWEWRHFSFQKEDSEGFARSRELARSCGAYAKFMAGDEKDGKEAVRAGWAAVGMGHRLMDDWPTRDDPVSGKTVMIALVGWAVTTISYKHLLATYEILEDNEHYGAVSAESAAFGKRSEEYQSVINAYRSRNWIESY